MPTTWPVVSKLCLEAPVEVVGKVKGASAVASNLRPDPVPKTGLPGCQKGCQAHRSTCPQRSSCLLGLQKRMITRLPLRNIAPTGFPLWIR